MTSVSSSPVSPFSPAAFSALQETFSLFDSNSSGFIQAADVGVLIRGLGFNPTEARIQRAINEFDQLGDGRLDFPTFHRMAAQLNSEVSQGKMRAGQLSDEALMENFHWFDLRKSGELSVETFITILRQYGEPLSMEDSSNLLKELTIDGDGQIDLRKFIKHMKNSSMEQEEEKQENQ